MVPWMTLAKAHIQNGVATDIYSWSKAQVRVNWEYVLVLVLDLMLPENPYSKIFYYKRRSRQNLNK